MKKFLVLFVSMAMLLLMLSVNNIYAFAGSSQKNPNMQSQQGMTSLSGKVVESMNSGGYTYINIEKNGKKTWVAVPQIKVKVGQDISFQPGMAMNNFQSKTLNRTFETIIFSSGAIGQGGTDSAKKTSQHNTTDVSQKKAVNVEKANGSDAYTVAELYKKSSELNRKGIVIRGEVVKFSANIMGKNWIHIQDGSGNPSKGTNDIIVTSQDLLAIGDIVTFKGTLYTNKDFGSGYKYAVIVEEASVKK